jgi:FkbM family methyltransferase
MEQSTHRLVMRRRLPPPFGAVAIYASSEGGLRYLRPRLKAVDPTLLRLAAEVVQEGNVVWDIGANLGLFSLAASVAAGPRGHVLAVEPDALLVRLLRRSATVNRGNAAIDVLPTAVSDRVGVARFHIARRNRSTSHLDGFGTTQTGGIRTTELVPTITLDWLAAHFPVPDVIKIDVEAAEVQVLTGGTEIHRGLPAIICEVAAKNATSVAEILAGYGYTLHDGEQLPARRIPMPTAPPNTLAISCACP